MSNEINTFIARLNISDNEPDFKNPEQTRKLWKVLWGK